MRWDAILSVHTNPLTCGVATFNEQLGRRLAVPVRELTRNWTGHVLISIHPREVPAEWWWDHTTHASYDLLLHSALGADLHKRTVQRAQDVWVADPALVAALKPLRPVRALWSPSLLEPVADPGDLTVFTFGMAHKAQRGAYQHLAELLEQTGTPYSVRVSTAIHEGSPWAESFTVNQALLRSVFGEHLRPLGFLGDELVHRELFECSAVALLYEPAARANNTTLWAAMDAGATVITTLDGASPPELAHGVTCYDLARLRAWPLPLTRRTVRDAAAGRSWDHLLDRIRGVPVSVV